jgi:hypothetical protein
MSLTDEDKKWIDERLFALETKILRVITTEGALQRYLASMTRKDVKANRKAAAKRAKKR